MPNPNRLIAEDTDIQAVVINLMRLHLRQEWGNGPSEYPVEVSIHRGKEDVFNAELDVILKGSDLRRLGVVLDADDDFAATWDSVRGFCRRHGGNPPAACPKDGLILPLGNIAFGAWIMPDCENAGMCENFCHGLVPEAATPLFQLALESARQAGQQGAPYKPIHLAKAQIHTWLAWQEQPGIRMGVAIGAHVLGHMSEDAKSFARWFCQLYDLEHNGKCLRGIP